MSSTKACLCSAQKISASQLGKVTEQTQESSSHSSEVPKWECVIPVPGAQHSQELSSDQETAVPSPALPLQQALGVLLLTWQPWLWGTSLQLPAMSTSIAWSIHIYSLQCPHLFPARSTSIPCNIHIYSLQYPHLLPGISTSCLLYTSPSPRDRQKSRMPSSA